MSVSEEETRQAHADVFKFVVEWLRNEGKLKIFLTWTKLLFYKLLPSATLATGISKEWITVTEIVNATGTTMTKRIVILKHKKPYCFGP